MGGQGGERDGRDSEPTHTPAPTQPPPAPHPRSPPAICVDAARRRPVPVPRGFGLLLVVVGAVVC
jgi:hypothetical protein